MQEMDTGSLMNPKQPGTYFGNIVIQSKNDVDDFRAFAHVRDTKGQWWELRGYGKTAGDAADSAWERFTGGESYWDIYGEPIDPPEDNKEA